MSGDDCVKVLVAIGATQVAMIAALTKLFLAVRGNRSSLDRLHRRITLKS